MLRKLLKRIILIISAMIVVLFANMIKSNALSDAQKNILNYAYQHNDEWAELTLTPYAVPKMTNNDLYNWNMPLNAMQKVFCIEGGKDVGWTSNAPINGENKSYTYGVPYYIEFNGLNATLHLKDQSTVEVKNKKTAYMTAYVLAQEEDQRNMHEEGEDQYSNIQLWMWEYFGSYVKGLFPNKLNDVDYVKYTGYTSEKTKIFYPYDDSNYDATRKWNETVSVLADQYINSDHEANVTITNNKMKYQGKVTYNNKQYYCFGPFQATYDKELYSLSVTDSDKRLINKNYVKCGYKSNNTWIIGDIEEIRNGKDSYVLIETSSKIKGISKLSLSAKKTYNTYSGKIWILKHPYSGKYKIDSIQDIIAVDGNKVTELKTATTDISITIIIPNTGSLQMKKIDQTSKDAVSGIGFKVYSVDQKGWIKVNASNEVTSYTNGFSNATTFTTDEKGNTKTITKLELGKYKIYETSLGDYSNLYSLGTFTDPKDGKTSQTGKLISTETIDVDTTGVVKVEASNSQTYGELNIKKIDSSTGNVLKGIGFKVYSVDQKGWIKVNTSNEVTSYTKGFSNATTFTTDEKGNTKTIKKLKLGKYQIYETSLGNYSNLYSLGTFTDPKDGKTSRTGNLIETRTLTAAKDIDNLPVTVTAKNKPYYGELQIKKVDEITGKALKGIKFKIYSLDKQGWLKVDKDNKVTGYVVFDQASSFETDEKGETKKIIKVPLYTSDGKNKAGYSVYETEIPESLQNIYGLGETTIPIGGNNKAETRRAKAMGAPINANITVKETEYTNKQEYISLSGYVWEEIATQGKNEMSRNNTYDKDTESLINGIKVALKDNKGNVVKNGNSDDCITTTNKVNGKNGFYKFEKVDIDQLSNYHVEFEYDGITYQSIVSGTTDTSSKASETDANRNKFNNAFSKITGEGQTITNLNGNKVELKYNKNKEHNVTLSNSFKMQRNETSKIITIENNGDSYNNGYTSFPIFATTDAARLNLNTEYNNLKNKNKNEIITEIENINLGLYEREKPDLRAEKDIFQANVGINGQTFEYKYNSMLQEKPYNTEVGVEFQSKRNNGNYNLPIYNADAKYESKDNGLKISVVYKIALVNESTSLYEKVNSIDEYFSDEYHLSKVYIGNADGYNGENGEEIWNKDKRYRRDKS